MGAVLVDSRPPSIGFASPIDEGVHVTAGRRAKCMVTSPMNAETRARHGEPAAGSRRDTVLGSAAALAASVNLARPFPEAAAKVLTLTSSQDFDVAAVVAVLESDLALSTRILRLVNYRDSVSGLAARRSSRPCRSWARRACASQRSRAPS